MTLSNVREGEGLALLSGCPRVFNKWLGMAGNSSTAHPVGNGSIAYRVGNGMKAPPLLLSWINQDK